MGKRSSRRKNASMLDSDDDDTLSSSSTVISDWTVPEIEDSQVKLQGAGTKLLDECVDALFEKRGSTREKALSAIVDAFTNKLQHQFVEKNCVTLLHPCLNSIKKGSSKEKSLASRAIGLLALTVGCGNNAAEILEESIPPLSQALKSGLESTMSSVLECLAIVSFVGGNDPDATERSMQIMWQIIHPKLGPNVSASKIAPAVLTAAISAWSFLLTTVNECKINSKSWQDSISYFSNLLDKDDRSIRIAAGEAIALIFEIGQLDKLSGEDRHSSDSSVHEGNNSQERYAYIQGLKGKILSQVRNLSVEAGGKGSTNKKDLGSQRNLFRDVVEFLEDGYCPQTSIKIGGGILNTSTWSQLIQLNFLKRFLGGGFPKHMQENELLHDVFEFTPKKRQALGSELLTSGQKLSRKAMIHLPIVKHEASFQRLFKSPNSVLNKARTQFLNKQRMLSQDKNAGHFVCGPGSEEA
ncbi:interferon-related developmental regulator 1-like isoform X1 [Telopea speciosissima]|uniref:interferon-related developmental regulator 1-like isoform X1 n=1 Tax=Telopea speciosissima TaxID=54955 RepID=UPI001CC4D513|nr:interferon-related developmental regulator 1-like isoform X1 [Telopea speciosissima]XP_043709549.1 interferon-related developmental regulator 1-like isoform X1 [Telopea speciosissima]